MKQMNQKEGLQEERDRKEQGSALLRLDSIGRQISLKRASSKVLAIGTRIGGKKECQEASVAFNTGKDAERRDSSYPSRSGKESL